MPNNLPEKVETNLKKGGIIAAIITLLVSLFFMFLNRYSFICLDPDLYERADKHLIVNQP